MPASSEFESHSLVDEIHKQTEGTRQQQEQERADYERLVAQYEEQRADEQEQLNKSLEQDDCSSDGKRRRSRSISPQRMKNSPPIPALESGIVPPQTHYHTHQHQLLRIQPAIPSNANIRNILENVTKTEGPFKDPEEALKATIAAFTQDAW